MVEITLIRHGQTDWNAARRYQGQADIPLNQVGIDQAKTLALAISGEKYDAIYASDLSRAAKTAEILATTLKMPIHTDARLREICQGIWEGMSLDEVQEKYSEDFKHGFEDPAFSRAPGGESVAEVAARMSAAADEIAARHPDGRILLVSHGLAVSTLYCQANGISLTQVYLYIPDNAVPLHVVWKQSHK
ncbi:histidine phosphatase family protein [bacterium]|nr:histidine phosphatase family protein [bacterium]